MEGIQHLSYALDTFYFLVSGALVMFMAAGFSMLEAGLVRTKNTTEILLKNISLYAVACIMYLVVGYNIMYGGSESAYIPAISFFVNEGNTTEMVLANPWSADGSAAWQDSGPYYSGLSDFFFQVVFVATAMSIVSGAVAERMKLWAFLTFAVVFTAFIYPIQGYWKWGGGFLDQAGFQDFAGSAVVHMTGAVAALAGVILLGPRKGKYGKNGEINPIPGANLPLATLGTLILWLGWFGFNGGSELRLTSVDEANAVARVFVNTNMAASGGVVAALITARLMFGKADLTMALNGALAGLVAITAEPLAPTPIFSTLVGAIGGIIVVFSIVTLDKLRIDDPVGAISVHGVVGIWGVLAVCFTNDDANIGTQILGIAAIFVFVFITSTVMWGILKATMGIRVSEEHEYEGMDLAECGMEAYPEFISSGRS